MKSDGYGKTEEKKKQFYEMMEIMDKFSLVQAIQEPTRKENTLDLVFTNDISIFTKVEVTSTIMSDHDIIEITTNLDDNAKNIYNEKENEQTKEDDLQQLNFHNKDIQTKQNKNKKVYFLKFRLQYAK